MGESGVIREHLEVVEGFSGPKVRIIGRRIGVLDIVDWHIKGGKEIAEIAYDFDLAEADIHAALAYYWDNRDEIETELIKDREEVDAFRKNHPSLLVETLQKLVQEPG